MTVYTVTRGGTTLVAVPEISGCQSCYGYNTILKQIKPHCDDLPADCSARKIIWVPKTTASTIKAAVLMLENS